MASTKLLVCVAIVSLAIVGCSFSFTHDSTVPTPFPRCETMIVRFEAKARDGAGPTVAELSETAQIIEQLMSSSGLQGADASWEPPNVIRIELRLPASADEIRTVVLNANGSGSLPVDLVELSVGPWPSPCIPAP